MTAATPEAGAPFRRFVLWTFIGLGVGVVTTLVVLRMVHRDRTPPLTPEVFHEARQKWRSIEPDNYDIEVRVTGSQPAVYRAQVRGGQAQAAWRNGQPLLARRTFGTWSVPGMFGTMSRDVEALQRHEAGKADAATPRLTLRASFDPQYAYPARYRRIEWGSNVEVAWEVTEFRVLPGDGGEVPANGAADHSGQEKEQDEDEEHEEEQEQEQD